MKLIIDSNFKLSTANENFIREKSAKFLADNVDDTSTCHLTIKKTELWFGCQILSKDVIIVEKNADFHSCICSACKKFLNQSRRQRRRRIDKRRRQSIVTDDNDVLEDDEEENTTTE